MFITVNDLADETKCQLMFKEKVTESVSSSTTQTKKNHHDVIRLEFIHVLYWIATYIKHKFIFSCCS